MTFRPGDSVVWLKRVSGDFVFPVNAVVLTVTPKRIKIEANDPEDGTIVRHVAPASLQPQSKPRTVKPSSLAPVRQRQKAGKDEEREERITNEIVVDCYDEHERAMGWYCYLEDRLYFSFTARCIAKRAVSPLHIKDEVQVIGMAPDEECRAEMFVLIRWEKDGLAVPLAQLAPVQANDQTVQAIEDWHYWVKKGHSF